MNQLQDSDEKSQSTVITAPPIIMQSFENPEIDNPKSGIDPHEESMPEAPPPHIVEANVHCQQTIRQYTQYVRTIERAHRDSLAPEDARDEMDYDDSLPELARFAITKIQSGELSRSTARLYRHALSWHFSQLLNSAQGAELA